MVKAGKTNSAVIILYFFSLYNLSQTCGTIMIQLKYTLSKDFTAERNKIMSHLLMQKSVAAMYPGYEVKIKLYREE